MSTLTVESDAPTTVIVDELDREESPPPNGSPPIALPPLLRAAPDLSTQSPTQDNSRVLARLLSMADSYRESGTLHSAIEIYFELIREHEGTPQALLAEERLFDVARSYEMADEMRQARGIYEQLL